MITYTPAQQEFMEKLKEMGLNYDDSIHSFGYRLTDNLHLGVFKFNTITTNWGHRGAHYEETLDCCYVAPEWRLKAPGEYESYTEQGEPFYLWESCGLKYSLSDIEDPEKQKEILDKVSKCILSIKECIRQEEQANLEKDFV